jgi:hypothetical protein
MLSLTRRPACWRAGAEEVNGAPGCRCGELERGFEEGQIVNLNGKPTVTFFEPA